MRGRRGGGGGGVRGGRREGGEGEGEGEGEEKERGERGRESKIREGKLPLQIILYVPGSTLWKLAPLAPIAPRSN